MTLIVINYYHFDIVLFVETNARKLSPSHHSLPRRLIYRTGFSFAGVFPANFLGNANGLVHKTFDN